jgi:hypothetical protein
MLMAPSRSPAKHRHRGALLSAMGLGAGRRQAPCGRYVNISCIKDVIIHT